MIDETISKEQLIKEVQKLRQHIESLEEENRRQVYIDNIFEDREQSYRRLVDYLTDYIYTVVVENNQAVYTYHGPGCAAVTGYTSENYASDPDLWYQMIHEEDRETVIERTRKALQGEQVAPFEHRIIHKDGSVRWIKNTIVLRKDKTSRVISYDGLINDITELKHAEEEARLKQQQLIQADKMASLGILVSGVAHELNNPNNYILLNVQFLSEVWKDLRPILKDYARQNGEFSVAGLSYQEADENIDKVLSGIIDGSVRIKKIVNNLRAFARQDKGDLNQSIDVNLMVESAISIVHNLIKKFTGKFKVRYGRNIPDIKGNFQQLEQVVINLLTNACHALRQPDNGITVSTFADKANAQVFIVVEDEGGGIPSENLNRILDPFFTTKRDSEGTGLGLSISYQIIKNHGGTLVFKSKPGQGTRVAIRLPIPPTQQ